MAELLFEIGTEELPSWYVTQAGEEMAELTGRLLAEAGLEHGALRAYATPRRLAVSVSDLAEVSTPRTELRRGPAVAVAFDAAGKPTRAAAGFARSNGVEPEALIVRDTDKGRYVFAELEQGGESARSVLPPLLAGLVERLPAPRKMRWADVDTPFVRPVAWLLALLGDEVLPVRVVGLVAGRKTRGHRFLSQGCVEVARAGAYVEALRGAHVLADAAERRERTWRSVEEAASAKSLVPVRDEALLTEVANLIEWPFPVLGNFDERFLELPEEVLIVNMVHHQRFFPTRGEGGKLAPFFVAVSNNQVPDEGLIRRGYEQVLAGRLFDSSFFWQADRRRSLREHAAGLEGIGFHRELGSMADKVRRVGATARALADRLGFWSEEREVLEGAAPVFRADLATQMVYEFPELEGVMARAYALAEGYPEAVAEALEQGARPKGPEAPLPASPVGAVLAVADRLDKLVGLFAIGQRPSGSADPFGLRRDGIALARVLNARGWGLRLGELVEAAAANYRSSDILDSGRVRLDDNTLRSVGGFVWDRVGGLLAEEGIRVELVRAAADGDPPIITVARRCHLLAALSQEEDFAALLTLHKRAANLAKGAGRETQVDPDLFSTDYEAPLFEALTPAREAVERLVATARRDLAPWDLGRGPAERLAGLEGDIAGVLALKAPLDAFLDHVLVMVDDEAVRVNRLALLREVRNALGQLGALEELEGM